MKTQNRHVERSRDIPLKQEDPSTSLGMTMSLKKFAIFKKKSYLCSPLLVP
ncbi:MAG: hypothetical protein FWC94_06275 [Bacteroidales bacterium]|nr:hypothetical protein [Bacteroidales bacterium]